MAVTYNTSVSRDSLVFYVDATNTKSYPGSGSIWYDLIGGQNVTLYNTPAFSNGAIQFRENISGAAQYGTATVDYGILRQSGQTGSWTIEACFEYLTQTSGNGNFGLYENVFIGRAGCHGGIYTWPTNLLYGAIKTTSCWTGHSNASFGTLTVGNKYNAVFTYNNGVTKLYLNGQYISTTTLDYITYPMNTYSTTLFIGGINGYVTNSNMYFAKAYNKELSANEIANNFNAIRGRYGL